MNEITDAESPCQHHWLLGQPENGSVSGVCRSCGATRSFPAYLEAYDWSIENERRYLFLSVATAAGGARPSSGALLDDDEL